MKKAVKTRDARKKSVQTKGRNASGKGSASRAKNSAKTVVLKGTGKAKVKKSAAAKGELRHVPWSSVAIEALNPLLGRHFIVGGDIMLSRVLLKKGCVVPEHSHYNEQISYVTEGALKFAVDGREIVVSEGEVLAIPRNMPHRVEALRDSVSLDIFNPPRADWINKTDAYLR
jgi:quercetin dioxygenase-like cupin family protein